MEALQEVTKACIDAHKQSGVQAGGKFAPVQLDVSDKAQVESLWDKVPQELRDVDILGDPPYAIAVLVSSILICDYSQQRWLRAWRRTCRRYSRCRYPEHVHDERLWPHIHDPVIDQGCVACLFTSSGSH